MVVQFATKVESLLAREYPFRHRLRRCHTPPFVATRHLPPAGGSRPSRGRLLAVAIKFLTLPQGVPLGELANVVSLRG